MKPVYVVLTLEFIRKYKLLQHSPARPGQTRPRQASQPARRTGQAASQVSQISQAGTASLPRSSWGRVDLGFFYVSLEHVQIFPTLEFIRKHKFLQHSPARLASQARLATQPGEQASHPARRTGQTARQVSQVSQASLPKTSWLG